MKAVNSLQNLEVEMRILDIDTVAIHRELTALWAIIWIPRLLVTTWIRDRHGDQYRLRQDGDILTLERKVKQLAATWWEHISISEEQNIIIGKYSFSDIYTLAESLWYSVITSNTKTRTAYILSLEEGSVEVAIDTYDTINGTTIPTYMEIEAKSLTDTKIWQSEALARATSMVQRVAEILGYTKKSHSMMNVQKMVEHYGKIQADKQTKLEAEIEAEYRKTTAWMDEDEIKIYKRNKSIADAKKFWSLWLDLASIQNDIRFIIESHLSSKLLAPRKQAHYERLSNTLYKDQFIMHDAIARRNPFSGRVTEEESKWLESIGVRYKAYIASLGYTISQYEAMLAEDARKGIYDTFIQREWERYKEHPFQTHINSGFLRWDRATIEMFLSDTQ